ncbi:TonB-dependent receptor [Pigmentiphaga litoralis]|uniref:TonB-dependent receptor n=1 Tax=Pigmentiphaga litoralis TaxID=516702 RepID=UPI0019844285|nr:TonB-dependent siderophore receptor [Pigmentiphaga litoralis]GGX07734.1 TonB-dependent receptor [Pigmentiphaga litoralis]
MPHSHSSRSASSRGAAPVLRPIVRHLAGIGLVMIAGNALAQTATQTPSTLGQVDVVGTSGASLQPPAPGGQVARGGSLGLLGTSDAMNVPFSTINFTSQAVEDVQARTLADIVVNDASVRLTTGTGGFDDTFTIRGLAVGAGDVAINGLYGLSASRVPAQLVERVEILKGPATLINGIAPGGSVGGSINVVTKRASDVPLTRLTTTFTSKSNLAVGVDVGRRFGKDNEWGIRFNGLVRGGEGTVNGGDQKTQLGALALDYQGSRLKWYLDAIVQRDDTDNFRPQISLDAIGAIPSPPDARANWYPGTALVQRDNVIATRLEYDVTDAVAVYGGIGYRDGTAEQVFPQSVSAVNSAGDFRVRNNFYDSFSHTVSANAGVRWRLNTGPIKHTINAGFTQLTQRSGNSFTVGTNAPDTTTGFPSNIYNPSPLVPVAASRLDPRLASDTTLHSVAISDTMSFADDRLLITLGLRDQTARVDSFSTTTGIATAPYKASAVSPLAGIVFKPIQNVSVYGNYTAGLTRGTIVGTQYLNRGEILPPYKSKQLEAGVKADFGRLTTSAALYQITRPLSQATGPVGNQVLGYTGETRYRGLELSAYGEIQRGLRGIASVAFTEPEVTSSVTAANVGNTVQGVPAITASAGLDWDTPWVQGLALNGRAVYTSGSNLNVTNTQRFDSWTRFDVGARYRTNISGKSVVFRANIENLFDKNYWLTTGTYVAVGSPRTFVLSASIDF